GDAVSPRCEAGRPDRLSRAEPRCCERRGPQRTAGVSELRLQRNQLYGVVMHPITLLQGALVTALKADAALVAIAGADGVFDAAPKGRPAPYVVVARHDLIQRDGDATPGWE